MKCNNCNKESLIVNKYFKLCQKCNNKRLHGNEFGKQHIDTKIKRKSLKIDKNSQKQQTNTSVIKLIKLDEEFYEKCFKMSDHRCEECGQDLPTDFRDSEGKIIARFRYSHIIPKSIAKQLRYEIKNINHLCLKHHVQWDFGDKKSMKIYEKNRQIFPEYL